MTPSGVHVDDHGGDGPPVVLVHGGFCDATHWRHQVGPLTAAGRRVLTLDLPGHGRSARGPSFSVPDMATAVRDVMERFDVDGCVLVGHSYGCRIVLETADRVPEAVTGVVLVDGSRSSSSAGGGVILEALRTKGADRFVTDLFEEMFVPASDPEVRRALTSAGERTPFLEALETSQAAVSVRIVLGVGHFTMLKAPGPVSSALTSFRPGNRA